MTSPQKEDAGRTGHTPRVVDNDKDEISITLDGKEIRAWSYSHQQEQYWKMQMAREFVEGWYQAETRT